MVGYFFAVCCTLRCRKCAGGKLIFCVFLYCCRIHAAAALTGGEGNCVLAHRHRHSNFAGIRFRAVFVLRLDRNGADAGHFGGQRHRRGINRAFGGRLGAVRGVMNDGVLSRTAQRKAVGRQKRRTGLGRALAVRKRDDRRRRLLHFSPQGIHCGVRGEFRIGCYLCTGVVLFGRPACEQITRARRLRRRQSRKNAFCRF